MAIKFRILRGNTAQAGAYVGAAGLLLWDTQAKRLYVHDGVTPGGSIASGLTRCRTGSDRCFCWRFDS